MTDCHSWLSTNSRQHEFIQNGLLAGIDYSKYSVYIPYEYQNLLLISFKRGINFKASPILIKSPFILEGSPLAALRELVN